MTDDQQPDQNEDSAGRKDFVRAFATMSREDGKPRRLAPLLVAAVAVVAVVGGGAIAVGAIAAKTEGGPATRTAALADVGHTKSLPTTKDTKPAVTPATSARPVKSSAAKQPEISDLPVVVTTTVVTRTTTSAPRPTPATSQTSETTAAVQAESANNATSQSVGVTGQISCVSGKSVEGVWVSASQGSGYAPWKGLGNGSTSDYWYTLPVSESYSLHVGCGGTTSSWAVATYSPTVGGTHNSFNCYDVSGRADYGTCVAR